MKKGDTIKRLIVFVVVVLLISGCVRENSDVLKEGKEYLGNISLENKSFSGKYDEKNLSLNSRENEGVKLNNKWEINKCDNGYSIKIYKDKIYFGAFPDFGGPEDNVSIERIKEFEDIVGKGIAWAYFSNNWKNGMKYPKKEINDIYSLGKIPFVRLMPRSRIEENYIERVYTLENIINGKFDKELKEWARECKKDGRPLFVDFGVEMNGDWFPWSGYYNNKNPDLYKEAYRHIIDIFREENATNVVWFFHVNVYSEPKEEWNLPYNYYPGDDYIDVIGISVYGPLNPNEECVYFSELMEDNYANIKNISSEKPLFVLEFGVTDNHKECKKEEWFEDAFETILSGRYNIKGISYWHENWEEEDVNATLRVDSSKESRDMFRKFISKDVFLGNIDLVCKNKTKNLERTKNIARFTPGMTWQWQLNGKLNKNYDVDVYDIDLFDISKEDIKELKDKGIKVVCYFSAGSWEDWRKDKDEFPKEVLGKTLEGWSDEKWLDVSNFEKFKGVMEKRMNLAKEKGCDGIEVDNIDGYVNPTGFKLSYEDQLRYNRWLCDEAHKRGLAIGLKNDLEQIKDLVDCYDFAVNEQCFQYNECENLTLFIEQGKAVFGVEYELDKDEFCDKANELGFSFLKMDYDLDGGRESC